MTEVLHDTNSQEVLNDDTGPQEDIDHGDSGSEEERENDSESEDSDGHIELYNKSFGQDSDSDYCSDFQDEADNEQRLYSYARELDN